jgi:hypothetical protein
LVEVLVIAVVADALGRPRLAILAMADIERAFERPSTTCGR